MTPLSWQDLLNGSYEMFAGALLYLNVRQAFRDKQVRGVHVLPTAVFASWGFWNLYYYPHLNQWWSFLGGVVMVFFNSIWLGQLVYYNYKEGGRDVHNNIELGQSTPGSGELVRTRLDVL